MVYLPGIDGSGELLLGTAARIEERFRLLRLRYRLSANAEHRTYSHLAASTIETVSLRGVERALYVAESFGGAVGLRAAIDHPSAVAGLALVNTFPHFRARARLACSRLGTRLVPAWMMSLGRRMLAPGLLFGGPAERAAIAEFLASGGGSERRPRGGWAPGEGYAARLRMIQALDMRSELPRVRQPVALFASERDRIVDSVRQAREMERLLPAAELEILEGRGHVVLPLADIDWPARLLSLAERVERTEAGLTGA